MAQRRENAMIRFSCPRCQSLLEQPIDAAGQKLPCPVCGQRLQVPALPENRTVLANLIPDNQVVAGSSAPSPPTGSASQLRTIAGREHLCWPCPQCQGEVQVAVEAAPSTMPCPHCSQRIMVPQQAPTIAHCPGETPREVVQPAFPEPPSVARFRSAQPARRWTYDEDYEDDRRFVRGSGRDIDSLTRASLVGLICSLAGLALLVLSFLVGVVAQAGWRHREPAVIWLALFLVIGAFVLDLLGTIFGSRGMNPINTDNRGMGVAGLVCGIVGMVLASVAGIFLFCAGMLSLSRPSYWWW
jgi:DNA-directed RNA polymerase subunit RPC12/RpoP